MPTERRSRSSRTLGAWCTGAGDRFDARPDLVPPLADTLDVIAALDPDELDRCWIWLATPRHVEKAAAAGARNFQYCFSASESQQQGEYRPQHRKTVSRRCPTPCGLRKRLWFHPAVHRHRVHMPVRGPTDPERVIGIAADPRTTGATTSLCATPSGRPSDAGDRT